MSMSIEGVKTGGIENTSSPSCDDGKGIISLCQQQAVQRGELAVPVSAFAETWQILKQVAQLQEQEKEHSSVAKQTDPLSNSESGDNVLRHPLVEESHSSLKHHERGSGDVDDGVIEEEGREVKAMCPKKGSTLWLKNEAILDRVKRTWLSTGTPPYYTVCVCIGDVVHCAVSPSKLQNPLDW